MKKLLYAAIAAIALIALPSCVSDVLENYDMELLGSWQGEAYSAYMDGKPFGEPSVYVLTFTSSTFSYSIDGEQIYKGDYYWGENGDKYYMWDGNAIFYMIEGDTMTTLGANGSILYGWPKTFTR